MAQLFHPRSNVIARVSVFGSVFFLAFLGWIAAAVQRSSYVTQAGMPRMQPVPFSHKHHVGGLGLDCRYCHTSVENSSFAGMPSTKTCMTCHSVVWTHAELLSPVRESWTSGKPIQWTRVHNLPGFVYFNHSIHVQKGIGCSACHGQVDQMPLMWEENSLQMEWCLRCHRNPEDFIRPRQEVFSMDWHATAEQLKAYGATSQRELGLRLMKEYHVGSAEHLTRCSVCHR